MDIAKPEQIIIIRLMWLWIKRVTEKDKQVNLITSDTAGNLLTAAL